MLFLPLNMPEIGIFSTNVDFWKKISWGKNLEVCCHEATGYRIVGEIC